MEATNSSCSRLCIFALAIFAVDRFLSLTPEIHQLLRYADFGVCALFLLDFAYSFATAPSRVKYFVTWGWIDLLSSVPAVDVLRVGRAAQYMRVFRVLRGIRAARVLSTALMERRAQSAFLAAALASLLLLVLGSAAIMNFEDLPEANIKGPEDALLVGIRDDNHGWLW